MPHGKHGWSVLVIWDDGAEEYVRQGNRIAVFRQRSKAVEHVEFMKLGIEGAQSINVVAAPCDPPTLKGKTNG